MVGGGIGVVVGEAAIEEIAAQLAFEVAETPAPHVLEDAAAQEAIGSDAGAAGAGGVGVATDQAGAHHVDEFVVVEPMIDGVE